MWPDDLPVRCHWFFKMRDGSYAWQPYATDCEHTAKEIYKREYGLTPRRAVRVEHCWYEYIRLLTLFHENYPEWAKEVATYFRKGRGAQE